PGETLHVQRYQPREECNVLLPQHLVLLHGCIRAIVRIGRSERYGTVRTMSSRNLTPVSYVVLGLIARDGPSTPYEVKRAVARGIAHFWPFPHSQIYSETEYLTGLGLLAEERERSGRRRRTFRVTDGGRRALESWLCEPTSDAFQIRSY